VSSGCIRLLNDDIEDLFERAKVGTQVVVLPGNPPATRAGGFRLGRILGVPVYLRYSWLLLAFVVIVLYARVAKQMLPDLGPTQQYGVAVGFVLCLLLSVLLHELGHALVARHYGIRVRAITLELLGGYTEMESDSPNAKSDLLVSLVGPAVSGVLGFAALFGVLALLKFPWNEP